VTLETENDIASMEALAKINEFTERTWTNWSRLPVGKLVGTA